MPWGLVPNLIGCALATRALQLGRFVCYDYEGHVSWRVPFRERREFEVRLALALAAPTLILTLTLTLTLTPTLTLTLTLTLTRTLTRSSSGSRGDAP